jgi:hypothetical protein
MPLDPTTPAYNGQSAVFNAYDNVNNAHRVNIVAGGGGGGGVTPVYIDSLPFNAATIEGSILSPTQEQYNYKDIDSVSVAIMTVTYADAFKDFVALVSLSR